MDNAISGRTSPDAAGTTTTHQGLPSCSTNELRENSSVSTGSATVSHPPDGLQMASSPSNEAQISSTPCELSYSQPNARPPGNGNDNYGYQYEPSKDSKDDLPTYEEAIKAMECSDRYQAHWVVPDNDPMHYYRYPDGGQFGVQDQYFYPQSYQSCNTSDTSITVRKAVCARLIFSLVLVGFATLAIRMIFFMK